MRYKKCKVCGGNSNALIGVGKLMFGPCCARKEGSALGLFLIENQKQLVDWYQTHQPTKPIPIVDWSK